MAETHLTVGQTVYNADDTALGTVRGFDEDGFFVTTREGIEAPSVEHERAGHEFGGGGAGVAVFAVWGGRRPRRDARRLSGLRGAAGGPLLPDRRLNVTRTPTGGTGR